jgi:cell division protein FtsZ
MEDNVTPEAVVPVAGNEELMAMSSLSRTSLKSFLLLGFDFTFTSPKLQSKRSTTA